MTFRFRYFNDRIEYRGSSFLSLPQRENLPLDQ